MKIGDRYFCEKTWFSVVQITDKEYVLWPCAGNSSNGSELRLPRVK